MASHSSSSGRSTSLRGRSTGVSLLGLGRTGVSSPFAPELPLVLQHAIKGFQQEVTMDLDGAAAREKLGFDFGALLA